MLSGLITNWSDELLFLAVTVPRCRNIMHTAAHQLVHLQKHHVRLQVWDTRHLTEASVEAIAAPAAAASPVAVAAAAATVDVAVAAAARPTAAAPASKASSAAPYVMLVTVVAARNARAKPLAAPAGTTDSYQAGCQLAFDAADGHGAAQKQQQCIV